MSLRVAVVQVGYGDDETVADRVARVAGLVRAQAGHDLVVLPELWAPGGFAYRGWDEHAESVDGPTAQAMAGAARDAGVLLHAGSIIERTGADDRGLEGRGLWNTSLVFAADGTRVATYRKIHRFGFGAGEPRLLEAGVDPVVLVDLPSASGTASASGTEGNAGGQPARAALSTCYDLRFPELYRRQLDAGASVFVVPAAWPMARVAHWTLLGRARAIEDQCILIACNTAGTHAGHQMGGASQVVLPTGEVLAEAGADEQVLSVQIDLAVVAATRSGFPVLGDRRL